MELKRKTRVGKVVSTKMDKTVVVAIGTSKRHPIYHKTVRRIVKCNVHDEKNECREGDEIRIIETRPLSRTKRWRVMEILTRSEAMEVRPEEVE